MISVPYAVNMKRSAEKHQADLIDDPHTVRSLCHRPQRRPNGYIPVASTSEHVARYMLCRAMSLLIVLTAGGAVSRSPAVSIS